MFRRIDIALLQSAVDLFPAWFYKHLAPSGAKGSPQCRYVYDATCK
jgi:hypothetical protein